MKCRILLSFFILLSLASCKKEGGTEDKPPVSVEASAMTYNIRVFSPDDIANGDGWEDRKDAVLGIMRAHMPDFIGLQEDLILQLPYLREQLREYAFIDGSPGNDITKPFNTLCYRKDLYKLIKSRRFWLSETPNTPSVGWDARESRLCVYGEFEHIASRKRIHVLNTHFDHIGAEARRQSAALVIKRIKEWTGGDSTARILFMGDLNATNGGGGKPVHDTLKTHLSDALEDVPGGLQGPKGTFSGFDGANLAVNRIDFIYQRNLKFNSYRHIDDKRPNGRYPSDHLPVLGKFSY